METRKKVHVIGGGTRFHLDSHLYLGSKATGRTARVLLRLCKEQSDAMDVILHLTNMADPASRIDTNADVKQLVHEIVEDPYTKIIFFNAAVVDFEGKIGEQVSGKEAARLRTSDDAGNPVRYIMEMTPTEKLLRLIRADGETLMPRKDIFLVAFKQTSGETPAEQYRQGLHMLKSASANLVLANDQVSKLNMIIVPEEATYCVSKDRDQALAELVEMAYLRSHLTFTRSTVIAGEPISWESDLIPASLRTVVDHCIKRGAYKKFRGVTVGHFAVKIDDTNFLTSRRKTDFNDMARVGLVKIRTDGPDSVIAYGSKPSVGGQSQRIVFAEHPDADCIVHFHCPIKPGSAVPTVSQRAYECGSHECGKNTSQGLARFGNMEAVYLDNHGPNVVFGKSVHAQEVIGFIEANFYLTQKTGGYAVA